MISSAITNAPPPDAVANFLHRLDRVHFFNWQTHENMMTLFREDPQGNPRKNSSTMPARNYAIITEHAGRKRSTTTHNMNGEHRKQSLDSHQDMKIAKEEVGGTVKEDVSAATPSDGTTRPFALDVAFRVEVDPKDPEGRTKGYGFSIPALEV